MITDFLIRLEATSDREGVEELLLAAFPTSLELRQRAFAAHGGEGRFRRAEPFRDDGSAGEGYLCAEDAEGGGGVGVEG